MGHKKGDTFAVGPIRRFTIDVSPFCDMQKLIYIRTVWYQNKRVEKKKN